MEGSEYKLSSVIGKLIKFIKAKKGKQQDIPPFLILGGANQKSGLSSKDIAKNIIKRQADLGIPVGNAPDGTVSIAEQMEIVRVEEILNALFINAKITVVIPAGISVTSTGGNAAGQVVSQGVTTAIAVGTAIIQ